jgi:RimJ/RimL family protein N-acetyltransferase
VTAPDTLTLRPALPADCWLLWEWANDPVTRAASFETRAIGTTEHTAWYTRKLADPGCRLYIAADADGVPIGQVRFDARCDGGAEVSISIAPGMRGRGHGASVLAMACHAYLETADAAELVAYIRPENDRSVRIFTRVGFVPRGREIRQGYEALRLVKSARTAGEDAP